MDQLQVLFNIENFFEILAVLHSECVQSKFWWSYSQFYENQLTLVRSHIISNHNNFPNLLILSLSALLTGFSQKLESR